MLKRVAIKILLTTIVTLGLMNKQGIDTYALDNNINESYTKEEVMSN